MTLQTTIQNSVTCQGIGLHSGANVTMRLVPAGEDVGILFRRTDIEGKKAQIPARYDLVTETRLGTTLKNAHGISVSTVEHLMAALWGEGVDNLIIEIDGPEVPIMDGSSEPFVALIEQAGVKKLSSPRKVIRVLKTVEVSEGESACAVQPYEGDEYASSFDIEISFAHKMIATQHALYDFSRMTFRQMLSRARTFGFAHEVEALRTMGLARGGSLDNAIVLGEDSILNEEGLRYADEFVRHKALDCAGDLYLAGYRIEGAFSFTRPGHGINNKLIRALMADKSAWKLVSTAADNHSVNANVSAAAYV